MNSTEFEIVAPANLIINQMEDAVPVSASTSIPGSLMFQLFFIDLFRFVVFGCPGGGGGSSGVSRISEVEAIVPPSLERW